MKNIFTPIGIVRMVLIFLCLFATGFIFYNSIQTGEQSAETSSDVVEIVQEVAQVVAPNSKVATATGEDYDLLHAIVRNLAHFSEFALLGAVCVWCLCSFTMKKKFLIVPMFYVIAVAVLDECMQSFVEGRGAQMKDVGIDVFGGVCGGIVAFLTVIVCAVLITRKKKREGYNAGEFGNCVDKIQ